MTLSADAIAKRMADQNIERRLVVTPLLDRATQLKADQAGLDVRLGRAFSIVRPWTHGVAELHGGAGPPPPMERVILDFGQPLIIHPHQFVLARTLEFVRLPLDLSAYVIGRSSWGRRGLIVATAVVVHPGFAGPITLELKNVGEVPLALYPLDRVAQLTLHDVIQPLTASPTSTSSQFSSLYAPGLGQVRDEATRQRIENLARENSDPGRVRA